MRSKVGAMVRAPLLATMLLLGLVSQLLPMVSAKPLFNICKWEGAMPLLYHEYYADSCPPYNIIQPNGVCQPREDTHIDTLCDSFCEVRTYFIYGQEVPYATMPLCSGATTCTLTETTHQGYAWKAKLNGNFKEGALATGITGGYSEKAGRSEGFKYNKRLEHNEMGYFTFIPIVKISCGTYSQGTRGTFESVDDCKNDINTGNACIEQLVKSTDDSWDHWWEPPIAYRHVRGVAVFVMLDPTTLEPLPDDRQEAPFNQPGVRLPRTYPMAMALKTIWRASLDKPLVAQSNAAKCDDGPPLNATDCQQAVADAYNRGGDLVPLNIGFKGESTTISRYQECTIELHVDEDWQGQNCGIPVLEIVGAAQSIMDTCLDEGANQVGGSHVVRNSGNCGCSVYFIIHPPSGPPAL